MRKVIIIILATLGLKANAQNVKTYRIEKNYLNIPIQSSVKRQRINFKIDGKQHTYNDIELANNKIDYWTFVDVSRYKGKKFSLEFSEQVEGVEKIFQSDRFVGEDSLYKERLRPKVHFTTRRGWSNDPNGLVYYDGEYHLFYQHNPYGIKWGNMTWGHAVSNDLLHWEELPIALEPDELGTMFSGSAIIDYKNTAGFGEDKTPAMIVFYTAADMEGEKQQQCVAYSTDKGRTFTKYEGNPIIPTERKFGSGHERDPKVFWYEPGSHWVMILHDGINYSIYNSGDLKHWTRTSYVDAGFWECPELFELPVDGDEGNKKWVVYGVRGTYLIGDFDGKTFQQETEMLRYNMIPMGMTAAQTYNDQPEGRRIQIGWGHAKFPGMPFSQTFSIPQEFSLKTTPNGVRLFVKPIQEIENLYTKSYNYDNVYFGDDLNKELQTINKAQLHIKTKIEIENASTFWLNINGYRLEYNVANNTLNDIFIPLKNRQLDLEIIVDNTIVEVYANGGQYYWFVNNETDSNDFYLKLENLRNGLNQHPKTLVKSLDVHELESIWLQDEIHSK